MFLGEGGNLHDRLANAFYADLSGLAPIYIQVGGDETLLDDSRRFAELAGGAGVNVRLEIFPEQQHTFQMGGRARPRSRRSDPEARGVGATQARADQRRPLSTGAVSRGRSESKSKDVRPQTNPLSKPRAGRNTVWIDVSDRDCRGCRGGPRPSRRRPKSSSEHDNLEVGEVATIEREAQLEKLVAAG